MVFTTITDHCNDICVRYFVILDTHLGTIEYGVQHPPLRLQRPTAFLREVFEMSVVDVLMTSVIYVHGTDGSCEEQNDVVDPVIEEIDGKQPESLLSREFNTQVLQHLPIDKSKEIIWNCLVGNQNISEYAIPETVRDELLTNQFKKVNQRLIVHK
jgi:hypothetical protein